MNDAVLLDFQLGGSAFPVACESALTRRDADGPSMLVWLAAHAPPTPACFEVYPDEKCKGQNVIDKHAAWAVAWAEAVMCKANLRLSVLEKAAADQLGTEGAA